MRRREETLRTLIAVCDVQRVQTYPEEEAKRQDGSTYTRQARVQLTLGCGAAGVLDVSADAQCDLQAGETVVCELSVRTSGQRQYWSLVGLPDAAYWATLTKYAFPELVAEGRRPREVAAA